MCRNDKDKGEGGAIEEGGSVFAKENDMNGDVGATKRGQGRESHDDDDVHNEEEEEPSVVE